MPCLSREAIKLVSDLKTEKLLIPEWDSPEGEGYLFVRVMTAGERERWENKTFQTRGKDVQVNMKNVMTSLAIECCVDDAGVKLFGADDVEMLNSKSSVAMQRIWEKARDLNRIGKQDVEELTKNSETTLEDASLSA